MGKGYNEGEQEGHNSPGTESPWASRLTAWGAEKAQQCHKNFLQYSTFASEKPQIRKGLRGRQTCLLSRAPSNLVASLAWGEKQSFKKLYIKILIFPSNFCAPVKVAPMARAMPTIP